MTGTRAAVPPAQGLELPPDAAVGEAARVWLDVARNEEARFNNLNTRAVGVLTVAGLVTSVAGFFAKDLQSGTALAGWVRGTCALLLAVALLLLALAARAVVAGVLWPRGRPLFGNNDLTNNPARLADPCAVHRVVVAEFSTIAVELQARNTAKAGWLERAYACVLLAVVTISAAGILVAGEALLDGP